MGYGFALERETKAALLIKDAIASAGEAGDEDLLVGCIEGETGLMEQIDRLLLRGSELAAMVGALDAQTKDIHARKARFKAGDDAIRAILFQVMTTVDLARLERPLATISVRAGSKRVAVLDEALLGDEFFKVERSVSLTAIKQAIDAGQEVLGAAIVQGEPSLMVKRS